MFRDEVLKKLGSFCCAVFPLLSCSVSAGKVLGQDFCRLAYKGDKLKIYRRRNKRRHKEAAQKKILGLDLLRAKRFGDVAIVTSISLAPFIYRNSDNAFQRALIGDNIRKTYSVNLSFERQKIEIGNLRGYIYKDDNVVNKELSGKYIIFYSGSGSSNTFQVIDVAEEYVKKGAVVIGVDYSGFGDSGDKVSSGKIRKENIYCDALKVFDYVIEDMKINPENVIIHGYSLGGPVAAHVCSERLKAGYRLGGLILQSSMKNTPNAVWGVLKDWGGLTRLLGTFGGYLFACNFDCVEELKGIYKSNPNLPISICGGNASDHLRLEYTKLNDIAEKMGFKNLTVHNGTKGHILKAPKENFRLPILST